MSLPEQAFQSFRLHHLEKTHAHNIGIILNHPLIFSVTPEPFSSNKWALFLTLLVIIVPVCVCVHDELPH